MKSAEKAKGVTLDPIIDKAEDSYREPFIKDDSSGSESQRD